MTRFARSFLIAVVFSGLVWAVVLAVLAAAVA